MTDYARTISFVLPGAQFGIAGNDYALIEWMDARPQPTQAELDAAWPQLQAQDAAAAQAASTAASSTAALEQQLNAALVSLRGYRDAASPTNAQTITIVKLLCRVAISFIRFRLNQLESTD